MNAMTSIQDGARGLDPILVALDGGTTVTSGIPDMDEMRAVNAYAKAPGLVNTLAPAPVPAAAPLPAPQPAEELLDHDMPTPMPNPAPRFGA